jgi:hypothetical protein
MTGRRLTGRLEVRRDQGSPVKMISMRLSSSDQAAEWARQSLPEKNRLRASDAMQVEGIPLLAKELAALQPDVMLSESTPAAVALKQQTLRFRLCLSACPTRELGAARG